MEQIGIEQLQSHALVNNGARSVILRELPKTEVSKSMQMIVNCIQNGSPCTQVWTVRITCVLTFAFPQPAGYRYLIHFALLGVEKFQS